MKAAALPLLALSFVLAGCSQGMHDGFEAARRDVADGRPPVFDRHPRFRNPPVPPPAIPEYRDAFRQGYERFLHPGPGGPPPGY